MTTKEPVTHEFEVPKNATLEQFKTALSNKDFVKKVHDAFQAGSNVQMTPKVKENGPL